MNFKHTRFACYLSYIVQAIVVNIAPLFFVVFRRDFGISVSALGTLVLFEFIVQLIVDIASIRIIGLFGYKKSAVLANAFSALGLLALGALPRLIDPTVGLFAATFLYSIGGGLIEVIINPIVDSLPNDSTSASLALLHSFYSWGQTGVILISSALIFLLGDVHWYLLPFIWAAVPLFCTFLFAAVPVNENADCEKLSLRGVLKSRIFFVFLLIMICSGATEMIISQWASYFAETGLGVTKLAGDLLGPCIFALMMAFGRTFYGIFGKRIPIVRALTFCSTLAVAAYLGIAFLPNPILVMAAFAAAGIAVSLMWPGTLAAASDILPKSGASTAMFALLAFGGDVGCSIGPWLNGIVNDALSGGGSFLDFFPGGSPEQSALRAAIFVCIIFPIAMLSCVRTAAGSARRI